MGRLAGFKYREIVQRLKALGFQFNRQAAGSHEIWFNRPLFGIQPFLTTQATCPKARCVLFSNKPTCPQPSS